MADLRPIVRQEWLRVGTVGAVAVSLLFACESPDEIAGPQRAPGVNGVKGSDSGISDAGGTDARPEAGATDASLDQGSDEPDPCGTSVITADAGMVPVYCGLHRALVVDGDLSDWTGIPFATLDKRTAAAVLGSGGWTDNAATDVPMKMA